MVKGVASSMTQTQKSNPPLEQHDVLGKTKRSAEEPLPSIITKDSIVKWGKLEDVSTSKERRRRQSEASL